MSEIEQDLHDARTDDDAQRPAFAHESEAELARILDFYAVRWEYEPHTFPILWNLDGDVLESFSPDFYLPDLDMYLELTTLKQRLVRKKNRKLRRLRELYPDIRIKLFYARDFRALMLKYGKLGLAEELSGATGQVVPNRHRDEVATGGAHDGDVPAGDAPAGEAGAGDAPAGDAPAGEAGHGAVTAPRSPRSRGGRRERRARRTGSRPVTPATSDEGART